jgi:hypothetical protein
MIQARKALHWMVGPEKSAWLLCVWSLCFSSAPPFAVSFFLPSVARPVRAFAFARFGRLLVLSASRFLPFSASLPASPFLRVAFVVSFLPSHKKLQFANS